VDNLISALADSSEDEDDEDKVLHFWDNFEI
jgi:hypothetical protein